MASSLMTADDPASLSQFGAPRWGIFTSAGAPILTADSVASVEYARDYHVSDYPQEQGAFESYNKVQVPYQAKIGFLINQNRVAFLNAVEAAVASLTLVAVITPEVVYPNANLVHYGYRREQRNGVTLIRVDVWCEEIRTAAQTAANSAATAAGTMAGTTAGGTVPSSDIADDGDYGSNSAASPADNGNAQAIQAGATGTLNGATIPAGTNGGATVFNPALPLGPTGLPAASTLGTADTTWAAPSGGFVQSMDFYQPGSNFTVPLGSQNAISPTPGETGIFGESGGP